jgi:DNA-binding HxlR family transcriptional regulator
MPIRTGGKHELSGSSRGQFRAGARVLTLFASPLNSSILRALADGPMRLAELRDCVGGPAETTLRGYLRDLVDIGVVTKVERRTMPYSVSRELTEAGRDLLFVLDVLETWLARSPQGEIALGTDAAKAAIKGLADGWGSAILRALAAQPLSLTALDNTIVDISYPALERRLYTMRITGQIETVESDGAGTPYAITPWARRGIAPLAAAGRWERLHLGDETEPVTWLEVEAAFLMSLPLVALPESADGDCVLAVDTKEEDKRIAGVHLVVERGEIVSCDADLGAETPNFALGSATAWLDAVIDRKSSELHIRGDCELVLDLVQGINDALFAVPTRPY